jgi:hypothetical protein
MGGVRAVSADPAHFFARRRMTYYPTLDEDLARAKEILAKGKADDGSITVAGHLLRGSSGTIYGGDIYAAYKLLESFVVEIERLRADESEEPAPTPIPSHR